MTSGLTRAFAIFTGVSVVGVACQIAKGKIVAVFLGPEGVGILNQLNQLWVFSATLAGLGFFSGIVHHISRSHGDNDTGGMRRQISSSVLFLQIFALAAAASAVVFSTEISAAIFADGGSRANYVALIMISVPVGVAAQNYRGILSGARAVGALARAQMTADLSSVALSAMLVPLLGLTGAIASFIGLQVILLAMNFLLSARTLGTAVVLPRLSEFRWAEIRRNSGFGWIELLLAAISTFSVLLVGRWILQTLGVEQNGLFATAWRVSAVYFTALYAAVGGFYFPTLSATRSDTELTDQMNRALALFMFLVPPMAAFLIVAGPLLMTVLFSAEFVPAAALLLLMLPGDLFRISAETLGVAFLARRRFLFYGASLPVWVGLYLGLTWLLMPDYGLMGIAAAYLISQAVKAALVYFLVRRVFGFRLDATCGAAIWRGFALVSAVSVAAGLSASGLLDGVLGALCLAAWLHLSWRDPAFRSLAQAGFRRLRRWG